MVNDGQGTVYVRDAQGAITLTHDISMLVSEEPNWLGIRQSVTHRVADDGLWTGNTRSDYTHSVTASTADSMLKAQLKGDWLIGQGGNDHLIGTLGQHVFIGGAGDDLLEAAGGITPLCSPVISGMTRSRAIKATIHWCFWAWRAVTTPITGHMPVHRAPTPY